MLAGDHPVVVDQRPECLRQVEDLGRAVDLHVRTVPLVGEHTHAHPGVATRVVGLRALGVGRDQDASVVVQTAGDR
jgi:hypothetical protein